MENKPGNQTLKEMDKFICNLPKQNQEEIEEMSRLMISNKTESIIKKKKTSPKAEVQQQMASQLQRRIHSNIQRVTPTFLKLFQKRK